MHDRLQQALHSLTSTPILMYAAIVQRLNLSRINSPKCGGHLKRNVHFLNSWCKHTMSFFTSATAQQTQVVHCNNETRQRPSPRRAPQRFILRTRPVQQTAVGIHRPPPLSVLHRVFTHHQVLPARSEFDIRRMVPIIPSLMTPVLAVLHFHSFQFAQQVPHFLITHHKDYCTRVDNPRALIPIDA